MAAQQFPALGRGAPVRVAAGPVWAMAIRRLMFITAR
jgi:hypothetical protein